MQTEPFEPYWQQVIGLTRCMSCAALVETSWRWFATPSTWTLCYCEQCVEIMLNPPH